MKRLFKSTRFKLIAGILALLLAGMLLCAANGHSETAQSSVIGTIFTPAHWVAGQIADALESITSKMGGNAEYEAEINELQNELGELQNQLADYENLKSQNELYKSALELTEENPDFKFAKADVIGRDSADPFATFTINKGTLNGVGDGNAVLYGKYLIGIIEKAYPTYSVISTVINPGFSVSAYDINTGELSYVTGDAGLAGDGMCKFENLDSDTSIAYGSIIATAGISSAMPRGIIIGTVKEINDEDTDISTYAAVEPGTDIKKISSCLVLTNYGNGNEND